MRSFILGLIIMAAGLFVGFNYSSGSTTFSEVDVSYAKEVRPVFRKNCASCHNAKSGLGNWLVYKEAFNSRYVIQEMVVSREMPQHGGTNMKESDRELIDQWVKTGANK